MDGGQRGTGVKRIASPRRLPRYRCPGGIKGNDFHLNVFGSVKWPNRTWHPTTIDPIIDTEP